MQTPLPRGNESFASFSISLEELADVLGTLSQQLSLHITQYESLPEEAVEKELVKRTIIQLLCHQGEAFTYLRDFEARKDNFSQGIYALLRVSPVSSNNDSLINARPLMTAMTGLRNKLYHKYPLYEDPHKKTEVFSDSVSLFKEKKRDISILIASLRNWGALVKSNIISEESASESDKLSFTQHQGEARVPPFITHTEILKTIHMISNEMQMLHEYALLGILSNYPFAIQNFICNIAEGLTKIDKWRFQRNLPNKQLTRIIFSLPDRNEEIEMWDKIKTFRKEIAHTLGVQDFDVQSIKENLYDFLKVESLIYELKKGIENNSDQYLKWEMNKEKERLQQSIEQVAAKILNESFQFYSVLEVKIASFYHEMELLERLEPKESLGVLQKIYKNLILMERSISMLAEMELRNRFTQNLINGDITHNEQYKPQASYRKDDLKTLKYGEMTRASQQELEEIADIYAYNEMKMLQHEAEEAFISLVAAPLEAAAAIEKLYNLQAAFYKIHFDFDSIQEKELPELLATESQNIKVIKREGLRNQNALQLELKSRVPAHFSLGRAVNGADCFFDAVAQVYNEIQGKEEHNTKTLRELCERYAKDELNQSNWVKEAVIQAGVDFNQYLIRVQFTGEEMEEMVRTQGFSLGATIEGRGAIEGRMLCEQLGIDLHLIEVAGETGEEKKVKEQWISASGLRSMESPLSEEAYEQPNTIHLVAYLHHVVPLIPLPKEQNLIETVKISPSHPHQFYDESLRGIIQESGYGAPGNLSIFNSSASPQEKPPSPL